MTLRRTIAALASVALPFIASTAQAAELKVYASTAIKAVIEQVGPQFERATENKLATTIAASAELKAKIDQGAEFDVAILPPAQIDGFAASGKIDPASRATVAKAGLGVAIRAGAPKPDVSTDDALKRALLNAKSIGFNGAGASRAGIEAVLAKLGIADELKTKIKLLDVSAPVAVAKGDVEVGLGPVSEALVVSGVDVAGALPADVQFYLVLDAGVSSASKSADAAKSLIKFLTAPAAAVVIKSKGMEPG
jgi:molybdate transport system substrate-binding protein